MIMKKTDFNRFNAMTATFADGLEHDEAKRIAKSAAKRHKAEQARDWLKAQEAEFAFDNAVNVARDVLIENFDVRLDRANAAKLATKADLHQVFTLPEDYAMAA